MLKNKILIILLVTIMILAGCKPKTDDSARLSAKLSELTGKVDIKSADSDTFKPADTNSVLKPNGQIQTGDDGRVRLDLSTGTIIRVASSSSFTLASNEETDKGLVTKLNLELGKVFIILNGGSTQVETPSGVASVRGSYLMVQVDEATGIAYLTCLEGDCSATNDAGTVHFTNGQRTTLYPKDPATGKSPLPIVEPMSDEEFQDWKDNNPEAQTILDQINKPKTATPTDTAAATNTPTLEPVSSSEDVSTACKLIQPLPGSSLPFKGRTIFEWEAQPGAKSYVLSFVDSSGNSISFKTTNTSIEKYIEILPAAGDYKWDVAAFDESGNQLCKSETATFSKPDSNYVAPTKESEEVPPTEPPAPCDPCDASSSCFDPQNPSCGF